MELVPEGEFVVDEEEEDVQFEESFCTIREVLESCAVNSIVGEHGFVHLT